MEITIGSAMVVNSGKIGFSIDCSNSYSSHLLPLYDIILTFLMIYAIFITLKLVWIFLV